MSDNEQIHDAGILYEFVSDFLLEAARLREL